ncbi:MAG: hypothetical protein ACKVT2_03295 [Saprospiraceae bacterium]
MAASIEIRESAFRYFQGSFTFSDMNLAISTAGFTGTATNGNPKNPLNNAVLMGFAFFPVKSYSSDLTTFETTAISISLVFMGAQGAISPTAFDFLPVSIPLVFIPSDYIDLSAFFVGASAEDTYNLFANYNQSREFDLTFLNYETYRLFETEFPGGGIAYVRASISMPIVANPVASNYKNYRTLKFTPNPPPSAPAATVGGLDDVAFRLGEPCPPRWWEQTTGGGVGGANVGPAPVMFSTTSSTQVGPGGSDDIPCGCTLSTSNIRKAMVEKGIIKDEVGKPLNVLRYALIRILIWALILVTIALLAWRGYILVSGKAG